MRVDEDDYLARSRRRKEQLQREAPVPYIHGPREDENPIIDYIIKTHKYTRAGRLAKPSTAAGAPLRGVVPCVVRMENNQTFLQPPPTPDKDR